jgi:hypothetical protein
VGTAVLLGWHYAHPALPVGVLGGLLVGLVVWRLRWPVTFEAQVRLRVRTWWRAGFVYRRQWATAMDTAGLLVERHRTDYVPPLLKVRSTRTVDRVTVRMLPGQRVEDYAAVADRLAQTFGALDCRVRSVRKRRYLVELWFLIDDPLETVVRPFDADPDALTAGIPVAMAEDGVVFRLKLVGSHVLCVGATGAGKGSVLSAIAGRCSRTASGSGSSEWPRRPRTAPRAGNHAHQPAKSASHRPDHTAPRQVPVEPLTRCQGVCAEPPSASRGSKIFSAATSPVHRTVPLAQGVPEPKTSCR